jgi:hypothetical protein
MLRAIVPAQDLQSGRAITLNKANAIKGVRVLAGGVGSIRAQVVRWQ